MINDYIQIDGKKYKVKADGYEPAQERLRSVSVSLTGETIIQDFTQPDQPSGERIPAQWRFRLRVYITNPPAGYGSFNDLLAAYNKDSVTFIEHDDTKSHTVTMLGPLIPSPRTPAEIGASLAEAIYYVDVTLVKVY